MSFVLLIILCSCNNRGPAIEEKPIEQSKVDLNVLNGYWIMSDYIDSILWNKSIAEQVGKRMTWTSIVLNVENDTLAYYGLILGNKKVKLNNSYDSLTLIKGMGEYQLSYNSKKDILRANCTKDYNERKDTLNYLFRRVNENEHRLIDGIDNKPFFKKLKPNFYSFFIDSLLSGEYHSLGQNSSIMKLETDGGTSGFKNYNKYKIHDYFGTSHLFSPEDAIIFEDTMIVKSRNEPPKEIGAYSWEFKGDTLILTKMLTKSYESYYKGTMKYEFIERSR